MVTTDEVALVVEPVVAVAVAALVEVLAEGRATAVEVVVVLAADVVGAGRERRLTAMDPAAGTVTLTAGGADSRTGASVTWYRPAGSVLIRQLPLTVRQLWTVVPARNVAVPSMVRPAESCTLTLTLACASTVAGEGKIPKARMTAKAARWLPADLMFMGESPQRGEMEWTEARPRYSSADYLFGGDLECAVRRYGRGFARHAGSRR